MNSRTSATTWPDKLLRASYMVSTMPWMVRSGLSCARTCSTVLSNCDRPSSAKNSHCSGTRMALAAAMALMVKRLSDGGQRRQRIAQAECAVACLADFQLEPGKIERRRRQMQPRHRSLDDGIAQ